MFSAIERFRILREEVAGLAASAVALIPNLLAGLVVVLVTWAFAALLSRGAVGVGYAEDLGHCREVIARAFDGLATVQRGERVDVFVQAFGESSADFLVRWWAGSTPIDEHRSRDEVAAAIKRALDDAGIEMPFPYRTLTFAQPLALTRRTGEESPAESSGAPAS